MENSKHTLFTIIVRVFMENVRIPHKVGEDGYSFLQAQNPCMIEFYWSLVLGLHEWQIRYVVCAYMPKLYSVSLINLLLKESVSCGVDG